MTFAAASSRLVWDPTLPVPAIVVIGAVLAAVACVVCLRRAGTGKVRRWLLLTLRLLVIAFICLLLLQPMREESEPRTHARRVALVAVDASLSMREPDAPDNMRRIDAAKKLLHETGLDGSSPLGETRLFAFSDTARPLTADTLAVETAAGETTRFHESLGTVLGSLVPNEHCVGMFILSDGHDFEKVPAARTARAAVAAGVPLFPIPFGSGQAFPDLSVRMAAWQPYTFVKQHVKLQAQIRSVSGGERVVRVELLREGKPAGEQRLKLPPDGEAPVNFEVSEEAPGQYEYEIRIAQLPGERDTRNNSTFTYLNVTASKLRVLLVEGEPGWDTTFLSRALGRNDRVELDTVVSLGSGPPRVSRPPGAEGAFKLPASMQDFTGYTMIILGREVDRVFKDEALKALGTAVSEGGVTLVMARGEPSRNGVFKEIAPAGWLEGVSGPVQLALPRRKGEFLPLDVLATAPGGIEALPPLPVLRQTDSPRELTGVEAVAGAGGAPAILHRRHGNGQVLSIAVEGLWKWALNAKSEPANNVFDRFWNQLLLNLLSRSGATPSDKARWTVSSANLTVGEKVTFTLHPGRGKDLPGGLQAVVYREDQRIVETPLAAASKENPEQTASLVLEKPGRYRAVVEWPGEKLESRFAAAEEQKEATDTTLDLPYLRALAEAGGGRVLNATSLREVLDTLQKTAALESAAPPLIRRSSLWDSSTVFFILAALFGIEWFLRRRWGLT